MVDRRDGGTGSIDGGDVLREADGHHAAISSSVRAIASVEAWTDYFHCTGDS
ncbi:hypothetical protein [Bradyrhizobium sp. AZCC 2230]|uniref:hypothetical protein n=1 Tax=Bradyrhizobium sp. AZCC 2230 TaxID=3117021 RepID=UPI002FF0274E